MGDIVRPFMELLPSTESRVLVLALLAVLYAFPQLRTAWGDFRYQRSLLDRMKATLELTKLRFEIEALKKQHAFPDDVVARVEAPFLELLAPPPPRAADAPSHYAARFQWAVAGSALFALVATLVAMFDEETDFAAQSDVLEWILGMAFVVAVLGAAAAAIPWGNRTLSLVYGFSLPFLLGVVVTLFE